MSHVTFQFRIDSGNAGVSDEPEASVADLMRKYADRIEEGHYYLSSDKAAILDYNGQTVGHMTFGEEAE